MRIAVTADVHLAANSEHPERYNALESILRQVEDEDIGTLVIAGDLFDKDFQNYADFEELCRKHPRVQMHIIPGNHDARISSRSIVGPNISIYTVPTAMEIGSATFVFVPYKEKATMGEQIATLAEEIASKEWVLVSHGDYYGGVKQLNPLEPGTYMPLSRENLAAFAPRVVFLGHIHKPSDWGNVFYAGSPCGLDICETGKRRFLVYDTVNGSVTPIVAVTDVLYFQESFVVVPADNEAVRLRHEAAKRVQAWNVGSSEYSKVVVKVEAIGYTMDRDAILTALKESFSEFRYYDEAGPLINRLSITTDHQLSALAERTVKRIDDLRWNFGGDEPTREQITIKALEAIYGA